MKSATWVVKGVNNYQYEVSDGQYIRAVNLHTGICECRKWQLSGIPCGHVIAVTRFIGLTDCVQYVADWFKKPKYQGTYSESIHFLGNMSQWDFPPNIQKAIPPRMDNPQPGRPKNTNRIKSQGEEPRPIHCSRCTKAGHRRDQCNNPFVVQPPVNIRTRNDQEMPRNNQPTFHDRNQQYDNTFHTFNQYTSQQYGATTYPSQEYGETPYQSQPYNQHFTNTSQAYDEHHTESSQMYEQYNSQQYEAQHLDDLNTNASNNLSTVLIPNDGSLEESFAGVISEETKIKLEEALRYLHQMHKRKNKKFDYYELLVELACQTIVSKLQREIRAEETLANQLLCNLNRYSEEMRIRDVQITMLQTMPATSLNTYGLHALLMTLESDIRTTNNILRTRQQLLRSITAKQNFINNYMAL
ncbi:transposase, MuDR, MULE transposase domain protein [Tanacetum coccineum]